MLGPSTSSERSTVATNNHRIHPQHQQVHPHQHELARQPDYNQAAVAVAAASGMMPPGPHPDDGSQFHPHQHHYNAAAHFQQQQAQVQQAQQAQLQQYQLLQQQQQFQQQQQQMQPPHHQMAPQHHIQPPLQQHAMHQPQMHEQVGQAVGQHGGGEFDGGQFLTSKFMENEIIKTFPSKPELVKFVKNVLNDEEQCKIVINSSKPKAVYFQCERSGSFRTTVKDSTKRQRVAYTKRNKCGYRLVANLYPPEKDKKRAKKPEDDALDKDIDDKLNEFQNQNPLANSTNEIWILRMIHPQHNHPPEPNVNSSNKKKRSKYTRTLVEKPLNRANPNQVNNFNPNDIVAHQHQHQVHVPHPHVHPHHHDPSHTPSVQDPAVIAAMEATPNTEAAEAAVAAAAAMHHQHPPVDPNIDPNVDPSVQEHDHSHGTLR